MRRLVLMRHAATESANPQGDKARELLPEGRQRAAEVGQDLAELGLERALVSTATRTRQTFEALGLDIPAEFLEVLYRDGTETALQRIAETDPAVSGLLVVGHAPVIPALSAQLAYASDRREADELQCSYPTATFTEFTFDGEWADLEPDHLDHVRLERVTRTHG